VECGCNSASIERDVVFGEAGARSRERKDFVYFRKIEEKT
jgi:hypothetical protein